MQRIGIAASYIAKGNLFLYNLFVVLIAFLLSILILIVAGLVIVVGLVSIAYLTRAQNMIDISQGILSPVLVCLLFLSMMVSLFCFCAIIVNMRLKRN